MKTPVLFTQRLILREFTQQDIQALYFILKDEEVNTFLPWFPVKSLEETQSFFEDRFSESNGYAYAICLKENNIPIGYIQVHLKDAHDFGYGLRKEHWHKGIVTEAAKAVIEQIKKDGLDFITATHDRNNSRSGNVMKNIGMKYCYSYEEKWQPKDILVWFRMYQLNFDQSDFVYRKYWDESIHHCIEKI